MKRAYWQGLIALTIFSVAGSATQAELTKEMPVPYKERVEKTLSLAGENRAEIERFLEEIPAEMLEGAAFLVAYMPPDDAQTLEANFLLRNTLLAYGTRAKFAWGKEIPDEIFFNEVLPYSVVDERREDWRLFLGLRMEPLVKDAKTLSEAAYAAGKGAQDALRVKYSTRLAKVNQTPLETAVSGVATCSGLSIAMVAALRSVCIPSRLVSIHRWHGRQDRAGHRWVEVWIGGRWYCCELAPFVGFDQGWFLPRVKPESQEHLGTQVFVNSYKETGQKYPRPWDPFFHTAPEWQTGFTKPPEDKADGAGADFRDKIRESLRKNQGWPLRVSYLDNLIVPPSHQPIIDIQGIDVTERYVKLSQKRYARQRQENAGKMELSCVVLEKAVSSREPANRIPCDVKVLDAEGKVAGEGKTFTNEQDINDHLTFYLPKGEYTIQYHGKTKTVALEKSQHVQLVY